MLNAIINFSIRNKLVVGVMVLLLIGVGILQLRKLPIDALPDITSNQVQIITSSPALAAPEIERLVTFTVEQSCSNIQGIQEMRSMSRFGLSVVTIVFNDKTDIYWARQQVAERIATAKEQIPAGAGTPELAPLTTGLGEVFQYIVKPAPGYEERYDLTDLRTIQDWIVRRQLLGIPGVADVSSFGGNLKQYEIAFSPERLKSMGTTLTEVFDAVQHNNQNSGGAYIEKNDQLLFIRTEGLIGSIKDIENIVVKASAYGTPVLVKDVADVRIGKAIRYGALVDGSSGEVSGAVVLMLKGANGMDVGQRLQTRLDEIRKTLPEGILIETFYDRGKLVGRAISTVKTNLLEGALIVVFVLVIFLGNLRAGLLVASVIPLAMLFAVIMMNLFGVSGNLMSLGALDFGLIVDGAVIIVEAVMHRLHHKRSLPNASIISQQDMDKEVGQSAGKMMNAAVFGQVIILVVYLPILALVGIEGKMFRPMAQTVAFALAGAFLLSLTYVPMMSALLLSKRISTAPNFSDRLMGAIEKIFIPVLASAFRFRKALVAFVLLVFVAALLTMSRLGGEFIPELEEGDFAVGARLLTGSSLSASIDASKKAAQILEERFPEVEKVVVRIGASEIPTDPMPPEASDIIIVLHDKKTWTTVHTFDEMADTMQAALADVPGLAVGFQFPIQMRFNEMISGARQDVVCKIFGNNLDTLSRYAEKIGALSHDIAGVSDLYIEAVTGLPQIAVEYKREELALYGITIEDVNQIVQTAFAGTKAGLVFENEKRFDLVLRLDTVHRTNIEDVSHLLIPTANGHQVPLYAVADVSLKEGPIQIQRENAQRRISVAFNVRNRDVESVVNDLQKIVSDKIHLPAGYSIHYGGAFENLNAATNRLMIAVPAALGLILLLLYFAFSSVKHSLLIFSAIPLSAIGGVFALWLRDMPFSISAGIGFIALFGVAVLNGIVLITEFNRLKKEGRFTMHELIQKGVQTRLRPVLMTASVASLGFLPMALSHGVGAEVQRPLASVVIGGLITATFLTLVVLPVLYEWVERIKPGKHGKHAAVASIMVMGLLISSQSTAQQPIMLEEALQRIPAHNIDMKAGALQQQYLQALQATAGEMPKTSFVSELGQINSSNFDTKFSLSQTFLPIGSLGYQKKMMASSLLVFEKEMQLKHASLRLLVRQLYAQYYFQQARLGELQILDSMYLRLLTLSTQRLKTGEANKLEPENFRQKSFTIQQQTEAAKMEMTKICLQLQVILQTKDIPVPAGTWNASALPFQLQDSILVRSHPEIQSKQEEYKAAQATTRWEKANRHPELMLGYSNQSFIGYQTLPNGTEKYLDAGNRFSSGQVGIAFPLLGKASKARVTAAGVKEKALEQELQMQQTKLSGEWNWRLQEQQMVWNRLQQFKTTLLPTAEAIKQTALQQLKAGELNYINWTVLVEPSLLSAFDYFELQLAYEQATAQLLYLTENVSR